MLTFNAFFFFVVVVMFFGLLWHDESS